MPDIRPARPGDIPAIQSLELDAGERFRGIGMESVAADPPPRPDYLLRRIEAAAVWVATVPDTEGLAGYATASIVDGEGHLDQVSVALDHQGRGIGRLLVDRVCEWAEGRDLEAVTLTTFRDVPWNGPLYSHLGFEPLEPHDLGLELAAIRAAERTAGLDTAGPRLAMRRPLTPIRD